MHPRMESEKRKDNIRSLLGDEVGEALRGCQMSARGFFYELMPMFQAGKPYGHIDLTTEELSEKYGVSLHMTRCYLRELKSHKVLRQGKDGVLFCPVLIRQLIRHFNFR